MTEDALLNTPMTALVTLGAARAMAIAIKANMMAYSTIVTPFLRFLDRLDLKFISVSLRTVWYPFELARFPESVGLGFVCCVQNRATGMRTITAMISGSRYIEFDHTS